MTTQTKKSAKQPSKRAAPTRTRTLQRSSRNRAEAADVNPEASNAAERETSATGRMHAVPPRELRSAKPRPTGAARKQGSGESGFGFKQIEERYTTPGKTGIAAETHRTVREVDEEVAEHGVGQGRPASGFVDYDRQEHTGDEEGDDQQVDVEAPAEEE